MNLRLIREPSLKETTLGSLYIAGHRYCETLEDQIREQLGVPVAQWKIPKETAIPAGRYKVVLTMSARFKMLLPLLIGVEGFTGIRIHGGVKKEDTEGCVCVGRVRWGGRISDCAPARDYIIDEIKKSPECWITVENPTV